jgi:hypothetical protein
MLTFERPFIAWVLLYLLGTKGLSPPNASKRAYLFELGLGGQK